MVLVDQDENLHNTRSQVSKVENKLSNSLKKHFAMRMEWDKFN